MVRVSVTGFLTHFITFLIYKQHKKKVRIRLMRVLFIPSLFLPPRLHLYELHDVLLRNPCLFFSR